MPSARTVDPYAADGWLGCPCEYLSKRCLARAAGSDDPQHLTRLDGEVEADEDRSVINPANADFLHLDVPQRRGKHGMNALRHDGVERGRQPLRGGAH